MTGLSGPSRTLEPLAMALPRDVDVVAFKGELPPREPPHRISRYDELALYSLTNDFAEANTSSIISGVSRPVNVFCWLGW